MLTVRFEQGDSVDNIYAKLSLSQRPSGANFVMYDEDSPVALWRMHMIEDGRVGLIDKIAFLPDVAQQDRLFFVHAMFFKLSEGAPIILRVNGEHHELLKFGFEPVNGNMEICSKNINLHYACGRKG